jgi:hypothetical protein
LPIPVDVLDLERHAARKRVAFIPAAALAFLAGFFTDVTRTVRLK